MSGLSLLKIKSALHAADRFGSDRLYFLDHNHTALSQ